MSAVMDNIAWESDEAYDTESDEAFSDGEDLGEDFGEAARRRGRERRNGYKPGRGVGGLSLRNSAGDVVQKLQLPGKIPTLAETNAGFKRQELARRALDNQLERLESRIKTQKKHGSTVVGSVTLLLGIPLTGIGLYQASKQPGGVSLANWASAGSTTIAAVTSATQLATTLSKAVVDRHYNQSAVGLAADVFAGVQLAAYLFGTYSSSSGPIFAYATLQKAKEANLTVGSKFLDEKKQPPLQRRGDFRRYYAVCPGITVT